MRRCETNSGGFRFEAVQLLSAKSDGTLVVIVTTIRDKPRFSHRGLLVDTARHYIPLPDLLKATAHTNPSPFYLAPCPTPPRLTRFLPWYSHGPRQTWTPRAFFESACTHRNVGFRCRSMF